MMTTTRQMPALSVAGTPTKRSTILELATEAERGGFTGLASPGVGAGLHVHVRRYNDELRRKIVERARG